MHAICKTLLPPAPAQPQKIGRMEAPPVPFHHFRSVVVPVASRRAAISVIPLLEDELDFDDDDLDTIPVPPDDHNQPTVRP